MADDQEQEQPPKPLPQEKYSGSQPRKPFSASLQRASYNDDDMIWPAPSGGYGDAEPTLPRQGREISIRLNATTLTVLGSVALLLIVALLATALLRNNTTHPVTQRTPVTSGGAIAQGTASVAATSSAIGATTNTPIATTATASTPGGNPVVAPTRGSSPPVASHLPSATPTPPTCNEIYPGGSPVTLFGDNGSGGSGSSTTIGSLASYLEVSRTVNGNTCIVTKIQQIVNVNLNNMPETSGSRCGNNPFPCVAQGTLVQTNQSTQQIVNTNSNDYGFGNGPVSRNIYGGTDSSPGGGNQCVTGTTSYTDNFGTIHQGGSVYYCWTS